MRFLFAHGAGKGSGSDWMLGWDARLSTLGPVHRFDYPYMATRGKGPPDRLPKLIDAHVAAFSALPRTEKVVLAGKSMGSRVGCHIANDHDVTALICFGYPLRTPAGGVRDEVLLALRRPVLFVQGERDPLCPLGLLADVRGRMSASSALHVVPTGNHSLAITKGHTRQTGRTQDDEDTAALAAIRAFLADSAR